MTRYLFVDGGCLRARVEQLSRLYCGGERLRVNWWGPAAGFQKIFYYDALPAKKPNQSDEEFELSKAEAIKLHAQLNTMDRFRVNEGDTRYRSGRGMEQKKVDVMIAVDMLVHTIRRNMTEATLIAGDADFTPLLNALSNEGMFVTLIHPPSASRDLLAAADARIALTASYLKQWLDVPSQALLGPVPVLSFGADAHGANCEHKWSSGDDRDIQIWWELAEQWVWVSWPAVGRADRLSLMRGSWHHTKAAALDDHGVTLPDELDAVFAALEG